MVIRWCIVFLTLQKTKRSIGTFLILDHIYRVRHEGLKYCHLGYWVEGSSKMEYKSRFLPQERLQASGWVEFN